MTNNRKMKHLYLLSFIWILAVSLCTSCTDKYEEIEKYQRPEWLEGKIYTVISSQENMSIFSQFMVDIGFDKVVDKTGTYAAFVPTGDVMSNYLLNE